MNDMAAHARPGIKHLVRVSRKVRGFEPALGFVWVWSRDSRVGLRVLEWASGVWLPLSQREREVTSSLPNSNGARDDKEFLGQTGGEIRFGSGGPLRSLE